MPKIRYLRIRFANPLAPSEVPMFRAAVIERTRRKSSLFHNHKSDEEVIYRYPLIQYKVTRNKASIVCLNGGTEDIHFLLEHRKLDFQIGKRMEQYAIEDVNLHYFTVDTWNQTFTYSLFNWLPLNQDNYARYADLPTEMERMAFLERILTGNILSFAKGIDWQVEKNIQVRISRIVKDGVMTLKGVKHKAMNLDFQCNVSLPEYIGIGKGSSVGFGIIRNQRQDVPGAEN